MNEETNILQLKNALEKQESDLIINNCHDRCEDFMVIDHTESLIPGKFHHEYVKSKDQLLTHDGSYFKALSAFLKSETSIIQKYMPDKVIEDISMKSSKDPRKTKETKAKVAKIKAKVTDAKTPRNDKKETFYNKKASEERIGK